MTERKPGPKPKPESEKTPPRRDGSPAMDFRFRRDAGQWAGDVYRRF